MFNIRPDKPWFQFGDEPLADLPGFRMNADGTVRDASPGDLSTALLGIDPGDSAVLPGGTMFNVQPGQNLPGLHNFRPPEERVPGFRMNADGSIRDASTPPARLYPNVGGNPFGPFDQPGNNAFTSVGNGSLPPYLAYGPGFSNGLGKVPTLDKGEPGGTAVSLPSNSPFFPGRGPGGLPFVAPPSPFPSGRSDPTDGPRPPATSFIYTGNSSPMSGPPFARPIVGEGLSSVDQSEDVGPSAQPVPSGAADPSIVRVAGGEQVTADDEVQVAQAPAAPAPPAPSNQKPGRGYGITPQKQIESGMTKLQRQINRDQAFRELTRQPLPAEEARYALPDDWETTKPANVVDDIKRAAERHGVPLQLLARLLYQEGKFGEVARGRAPLVMHSDRRHQPIGYAQMNRITFEDLIKRARERGDTARAEELKTYSLADQAQSFDAAAEQLAYLYRHLGGNWPKAVAAYNVGPTAIWTWFDAEQDPKDKDGVKSDPRFFATRTTDKKGKPLPESQLKQTGKWQEMSAHLRMVLRGAAEDPATSDMYGYQPPKQYRARAQIPPRPAPSGQPSVPARRYP